MIKEGNVGKDVIDTVDMDRINEDTEEFLNFDRHRPLALMKFPLREGNLKDRRVVGGQ